MKKILTILLCTVLLFGISACKADSKGSQGNTNSAANTENTSESGSENSGSSEKAPEKTAVVCFSGTGNTMKIAEMIANASGADLFEIIPAEKYTAADLNYSNDNCRANKEQNNPGARPAIQNDLSAVKEYDTVYLGYPIWWGTNPRIIQTFLDSYDLSAATIYTFCTSGSSGIERSISDLKSQYPDLRIVTGKRLNNASQDAVKAWIESGKK